MTIINVTLTATANSDNKTISQPNTKDTCIYTWDGLGGTDKLSFPTSKE